MSLDVPTLMLAGSFVSLLSGMMLVFAWLQHREQPAPLWWAAANFCIAIGVAFLAFGSTAHIEPLVAAGFVTLTCAMTLVWAAARHTANRKPRYLPLFLAPAIVIVVVTLPHGLPVEAVGGGVAALLCTGYLAAAAWTIARHAAPLASRWPLAGFVLLHAVMLAIGPFAAIEAGGDLALAPLNSLFGLIHFEAIIFSIGSTLFVVAGMREASEARHRLEAATDPMTGLANRRTFFETGEKLDESCRRDGMPIAVILFDLDQFKDINDNHGHATGDRILELFARISEKALRPGDLVGRIGGEEFAAVLPRTDLEAALGIAERTRKSFEVAAMYVDGTRIDSTLSAGVAANATAALSLTELLARADSALYRAKSDGRNRVAPVPSEGERPDPPSRIVRIA
jgi:diguanylate cyclase (GGDEF)-like protein